MEKRALEKQLQEERRRDEKRAVVYMNEKNTFDGDKGCYEIYQSGHDKIQAGHNSTWTEIKCSGEFKISGEEQSKVRS